MKVLFLCKASTKTGLGHLIRSRSLAGQIIILYPDIQLDFIIIGEPLVDRLLAEVSFSYSIFEEEEAVLLKGQYDICFFDLISMSADFFNKAKQHIKFKVSISPIFDYMQEMDVFFNRTKYHNLPAEKQARQVYADLRYTIIQDDCRQIKTVIYEENLKLKQFPIAISMGGGDAANKTLRLLRSLKNCKVPATFWVMLGEGYKHSYDALINEIIKDSEHEIILAKTNRSMWHILQNCILAILPGGITAYEAVYAGLPTLVTLDDPDKFFLIRELTEHEVSIYHGPYNDESINNLNQTIEDLYHDRKRLLKMHQNSKGLITGKSAKEIMEQCFSHLKKSVN